MLLAFRSSRPDLASSASRAGTRAAALALAAFLATDPLAAQSAAGEQCWTPEQLSDRAADHRIQSNVAPAFVPRPQGELARELSPFPETGGRAIRRVDLPAGVKRVAFTFDLCEQPHEIAGYQGDIVDYLRANNIKATFFSGGKWLLTHAERASQLIGDPLFEVGSHGWEHRNQQILNGEVSRQEIDGAGLAYQQVQSGLKSRACRDRLGQRAAFENAAPRQTLFRFPFGACSKASLEATAERGLLAIQWDVSSGDPWAPITTKQIVSSVMKRVKPGSIVLFHANGRGHKTEEAVPLLVEKLRAQGYEFVTVSELLRTPGARIVTSDTCYDYKPGDTDRYKEIARRLEGAYQRFYGRFGARSSAAQQAQTVVVSAPAPAAASPQTAPVANEPPPGVPHFSATGIFSGE